MSFFLPLLRYKQRVSDKKKYHRKYTEKYFSISALLKVTDIPYTYFLNTENDINFKNGLEFGISYDEVISLLGKPWVNFSNPHFSGHKVLLYKYKIKSCKLKCEFHFFQNMLILGKCISDCFGHNRITLKRHFMDAYPEYRLVPDYSVVKLKDPSNNFLFVCDSVKIEFIYQWNLASEIIFNSNKY